MFDRQAMRWIPMAVLGLALNAGCRSPAPTSAAVKALFADPPRQYSSGPLWVWNDDLTEAQVVRTLRDLRGQHVRQVWVHPRPGLMTPYLSDEWFRLWGAALDEAKRLDMNVWIYDENSYPSGFAGGLVPEAMPESRGLGLRIVAAPGPPAASEDLVAVYHLKEGAYTDVTARIRAGETPPAGRYAVCRRVEAPVRAWHAGRFYVDLLRPGVTEKFIEITLEAYRERFGAEFGRHIPGTFSDEPQIRPAREWPWTPGLPAAFQKRWGYALTDHLACLNLEIGDWRKVRHDCLAVLLDLFNERWGRPMHDYCEAHGLAFTGHYWEHEWPTCLKVPDGMSLYQWFHVPGIDTLLNRYGEGVHGQFGNVRSVRELASVANQLGRRRTLCEAYGAAGWDLRFEDMKRIGDWLCALGANTLNQHLSFISIRGARKRDHPASLSDHEPWWEAYHLQADRFARLSAALSQGEQINRILVIEPTTTAWMYQTADGAHPRLTKLGDVFQRLVTALDQGQVEYDLGSEDLMARFGSTAGRRLVVGRRAYDTVVIAPGTETLRAETEGVLSAFVSAGGRAICAGDPPSMTDARPTDRWAALSRSPSWRRVAPDALPAALLAEGGDGFHLRPAPGDPGIVYHMRRRLADGDLVFVVNTSLDRRAAATIQAPGRGIERWDPQTGRVEACAFERRSGGVAADLDLPPCGSVLLFCSQAARAPARRAAEKAVAIASAGPVGVRRDAPNVLTLDYVDVTVGSQTKQGLYFFKAAEFVFQSHGLSGNPWEHAVQFRDELIRHRFAATSGFAVSYRFTIADRVPPDLKIVIERPDLYRITCNERAVSPTPDAWWLDGSFGVIDLGPAAKIGRNVVTCRASPMTMRHEIEPAYLLGDFALEATDRGFTVAGRRELGLGPWNAQGHPFYGHTVTYGQEFRLDPAAGRVVVALPAWAGSVAKVTVNGEAAGYIQHQPWECDVTPAVRPGLNTVAVTVFGTLKNTLGPHHGDPPGGLASPVSFQTAPPAGPPAGTAYSTFGYGLFEPFAIRQMRDR